MLDETWESPVRDLNLARSLCLSLDQAAREPQGRSEVDARIFPVLWAGYAFRLSIPAAYRCQIPRGDCRLREMFLCGARPERRAEESQYMKMAF